MTRLGAWRVALLGAALWASPASAHPHMWIDYSATLLCHGDRITGVRLAWTFDQMYSASLFHDFTSRPAGALTARDIARLDKEAFQDSAETHYFTELVFDGKSLPVAKTVDFDAAYDGRKMTYRFTVPLDLAPGPGEHTLEIDSFDHEFYIDYELAKDPVAIHDGAALQAVCAPAPATKDTTTFGPVRSHVLRCRFKVGA